MTRLGTAERHESDEAERHESDEAERRESDEAERRDYAMLRDNASRDVNNA